MIDRKKIAEEEEKISKLVDKLNAEVSQGAGGRPYLLVLATLFEVEREGDKSKIAGQWNWRSNIDSRTEGRKPQDIETGKRMMQLLVDQLSDITQRPQGGIKTHYKL
jgi:hypothetical protein